MKTRLSILLSLLIITMGLAFSLFWWQALKEFSLLGQLPAPQSYDEVQKSFPTYCRACQITRIAPFLTSIPDSYNPGSYMMSVLRHLYPGLMVGQILVIVGCYFLVATVIPPRFKYTKGIIRLGAIIIIAWINTHGLWLCMIGPRGMVVSFGAVRTPVPATMHP